MLNQRLELDNNIIKLLYDNIEYFNFLRKIPHQEAIYEYVELNK